MHDTSLQSSYIRIGMQARVCGYFSFFQNASNTEKQTSENEECVWSSKTGNCTAMEWYNMLIHTGHNSTQNTCRSLTRDSFNTNSSTDTKYLPNSDNCIGNDNVRCQFIHAHNGGNGAANLNMFLTNINYVTYCNFEPSGTMGWNLHQ